MNEKELTVGMHVRITENLKNSKTKREYDINSTMLKMQGKVYQIDGMYSSTAILIMHKPNTTRYTFHPDDLEIANCDIVYPEPEHFNPENLNIS